MKAIGDVECQVEKHKYYNQRKWLIFIYVFDIEDTEKLKKELQS